MAAIQLTRAHRVLVGIVLAGAVVIATIGFVGSYAAVRDLAERKGFGDFAPFFPIGVDAGIVVLLALDLLLTWLRIPFPLLRQSAWLLTAATIAFNGASAWGDPLGVGMHAIIPVLFVITVEAARHAIGRVADITADRHMEGVRMWRWFLSPIPTFRLWRRMKLWELRSYQEVITMERDRLVYQAQLRAEYGRAWRRRAPVEARMPLKLARYGVPLRETAATGLAAARPRLAVGAQERPPAPEGGVPPENGGRAGGDERVRLRERAGRERPEVRHPEDGSGAAEVVEEAVEPAWLNGGFRPVPGEVNGGDEHAGARAARTAREPVDAVPPARGEAAGAGRGGRPRVAEEEYAPSDAGAPSRTEETFRAEEHHRAEEPDRIEEPYGDGERAPAAEAAPGEAAVTVPVGPGRRRALGNAPAVGEAHEQSWQAEHAERGGRPAEGGPPSDAFYDAYRQYIVEQGDFPNARQLSRFLHERFAITDTDGTLLSEQYLRAYTRGFRERYSAEMGTGV
ncbi:Protein of unknown function [Streptomyces zhaozhouensis]|uniref:DUF2637 domain-containing protein n=1 Tax=Streptomyces zhaozhouensis TaxID=1300267 RepID=A0A286E6J0_9ACTN|nr:DUF2637 domain-containing protein [Streptomyces zhaozhouensis]SOD66499.1 Protein of unknown function [Streptomyces zhaozhouensis]